jgi:hypothetical protein
MIRAPDRSAGQGGLRVSLAPEAARSLPEHLPFEVRQLLEVPTSSPNDMKPEGEARRGVSVLVERGTIGKPVRLAPGDYVVSALTPDGQVLTTTSPVTVTSDQTADAQLGAEPISFDVQFDAGTGTERAGPGSFRDLVGAQVSTSLAEAAASSLPWLRNQIATRGPSWVAAAVKMVTGHVQQNLDLGWVREQLIARIEHVTTSLTPADVLNALKHPTGPTTRIGPISWEALNPRERRAAADTFASSGARIGPISAVIVRDANRCIEIGDGERRLVTAVPCEPGSYTVALCFNDAANAGGTDSKPALHVEFFYPDSEANGLARYMRGSDFSQATQMAASILTSCRAGGGDGKKAPMMLTTLFACYVLLRSNELEPLRGFVDELGARWPDQPDATAIRIETYARLGRHPDAQKLCAEAAGNGVPTIASGIAYVQQRIRQYLEAEQDPDEPDFDEGPQTDKLKAALKKIAPVSMRLDLRTLVTAVELPQHTQKQ